jgi:predicted DNA-binding protein with PD1-like motif
MRSSNARGKREFLLICDKGDAFPAALLDFAGRNNVTAASFNAIGAFDRVTIAYWNRETKQYEEISVDEQVEVVSMTGNLFADRVHAHTVLGKRDGTTIAGHFVRATVFPTLEIFLTERETAVTRKQDEATGLWLLDV